MRFADALRHLVEGGYTEIEPMPGQPKAIETDPEAEVHIEEIAPGSELDLTAHEKKCYLVNNDGLRQYVVRK